MVGKVRAIRILNIVKNGQIYPSISPPKEGCLDNVKSPTFVFEQLSITTIYSEK